VLCARAAPSSFTCASDLGSSSTASSSEALPLSVDAPKEDSASERPSPATAEDAPEHSDAPAGAAAARDDAGASATGGASAKSANLLRPALGGRTSKKAVEGQTPEAPIVPMEERWFRDGDVVAGRVVWSNSRGARVQLVAEPRLLACVHGAPAIYTLNL
jgi:hypothetical protein